MRSPARSLGRLRRCGGLNALAGLGLALWAPALSAVSAKTCALQGACPTGSECHAFGGCAPHSFHLKTSHAGSQAAASQPALARPAWGAAFCIGTQALPPPVTLAARASVGAVEGTAGGGAGGGWRCWGVCYVGSGTDRASSLSTHSPLAAPAARGACLPCTGNLRSREVNWLVSQFTVQGVPSSAAGDRRQCSNAGKRGRAVPSRGLRFHK